MAELIGSFIANWPMWIGVPFIIIVGGVWMYFYIATGTTSKSSRYEWPEEKKIRLANKELKAKKLKKFKANLKLKRG